MLTTHTALIVPALTDQAGQCRIVARAGKVDRALAAYRAEPRAWAEVGIMNSSGKLVCCEPLGDLPQQLQESQPLMAGSVFEFNAPAPAAAHRPLFGALSSQHNGLADIS